MSEHRTVWHSGEDVQMLENALRDSTLPAETRNTLLKRASTALLAAGGLGTLLAACGSGKKKTATATTRATGATSGGGEIRKILDTAITAEALAVTYLSAVIKQAGGTPVAKFTDVLKAANAAEYDHYKVLQGLGAQPITTRFWAPNAFFGPGLGGVFPTLQVAETLFVNAYLIAITAFAKAGKPDYVRYASEIAGVEAQHLALARFAAGRLPNNLGFADYSITTIDGVVAALEKAGVGFGAKGSAAGKFVTFSPPTPDVLTEVNHTTPA
jgi:hypothetical protein